MPLSSSRHEWTLGRVVPKARALIPNAARSNAWRARTSGADRAEHRLEPVQRKAPETVESLVAGAVEVRRAGGQQAALAGRGVQQPRLVLGVGGVERLDAVHPGRGELVQGGQRLAGVVEVP